MPPGDPWCPSHHPHPGRSMLGHPCLMCSALEVLQTCGCLHMHHARNPVQIQDSLCVHTAWRSLAKLLFNSFVHGSSGAPHVGRVRVLGGLDLRDDPPVPGPFLSYAHVTRPKPPCSSQPFPFWALKLLPTAHPAGLRLASDHCPRPLVVHLQVTDTRLLAPTQARLSACSTRCWASR